ncbi:MAG: ABC transporter permease [Candidatus Aminicenantes bacterium]|nr:ABC transporter permease [Candidatus Aminicenantes bacterium]
MGADKKRRPPCAAKWILSLMSWYDEQFLSLGDLEEEFDEKVQNEGVSKARSWYRMQALKSVPSYTAYFTLGAIDMLKNYFKSAFRHMKRQKVYTFLNLSGLAIGMASFIIIFYWVQHELSFDRFHAQADRIYRVSNEVTLKSGDQRHMVYTSAPMAQTLVEEYSEIKKATRMRGLFGVNFRVKDKDFYEEWGFTVDPSFFDVFSFSMLQGDPKEILKEPYSLALSEKLARKFFGKENPLGKTLLMNGENRQVTGVFKDVPTNSHLQPGYLLSSSNNEDFENPNWSKLTLYTYVVLEKNTQVDALEAKIQEVNEKHIGEWATTVFRYRLQPITSIHLYSDLIGEYSLRTNLSQLYIFTAIAILILLVACINFVNLTTARYHRRLKEIGIRKVLGTNRFQLGIQFMCESLLTVCLALGAGLLLAEILFPTFGSLVGGDLRLHLGMNMLKVIGLVLFVGLISGGYPAFYLSSFPAVTLFREIVKKGTFRSRLRKILIVFQFAVTIILLVGTGLIYMQMHFIKNKSIGFNREKIVVVRMNNPELRKHYETVKNELLKVPGVVNATVSGFIPFLGQDLKAYRPEGFEEDMIFVRTLYVDHDFIPTMEMELAEGRNFKRENKADALYGYIVNEAAVKKFGWDSALGKQIELRSSDDNDETALGPVIGVLRDFHFRSFREEIAPLIMRVRPERFDIVNLKVETDNLPGLISRLEHKWKEIDQENPFGYEMMENIFDGTFRREQRLGREFSYFALISILIACLGLLGLVSFMAEERTKEIGIRKIHGASLFSIVGLLTKEILILVVLANVIAWPVSYVVMHNWMKNFVYRTSINPVIFIGSAVLALVITLLTVSFQSIKAALANPVDALRYE